MTIAVEPEGREGVWLPERESLKSWIREKEWKYIHNFRATPGIMLGADHHVEDVLEDIDKADRLAVLTGDAAANNLGHSLAVILGDPERLEMFDLGTITENDLAIKS